MEIQFPHFLTPFYRLAGVVLTYLVLLLLACVMAMVPAQAWGQMQIVADQDAESLVKSVLLRGSVRAFNVRFTGAGHSMGYFTNDSNSFPLKQGLIISNGSAYFAAGPNDSQNASEQSKYGSDADLDSLPGKGKTSDICVLEFDFVPSSDSIFFRYVFGSEEYPEFTNNGYNDRFGFFLSGPGIDGKVNLASLPGGKGPITVDNINDGANSEFYINNNFYLDKSGKKKKWANRRWWQWWMMKRGRVSGPDKDKVKMPDLNKVIGYDGYTVTLSVRARVTPYQIYHIKLAIADVGDGAYDSGVFLDGGSFRSYNDPNDKMEYIVQEALLPESLRTTVTDPAGLPGLKRIDSKTTSASFHINFSTGSHQVPDSAMKELDKVCKYILRNNIARVEIIGHTDSVGTRTYNRGLSERRAAAVRDFLSGKCVDPSISASRGEGYDKPMSTNKTPAGRAMNRRVEFIFRRE